MNSSYYILLILLLIFILQRKKKGLDIAAIKAIRKNGGKSKMKELALNFVGKECLIYTINDVQTIKGVIKQVTDNALLLDNAGSLEAVNLEFVTRIREYPRNKKGKKKLIVTD